MTGTDLVDLEPADAALLGRLIVAVARWRHESTLPGHASRAPLLTALESVLALGDRVPGGESLFAAWESTDDPASTAPEMQQRLDAFIAALELPPMSGPAAVKLLVDHTLRQPANAGRVIAQADELRRLIEADDDLYMVFNSLVVDIEDLIGCDDAARSAAFAEDIEAKRNEAERCIDAWFVDQHKEQLLAAARTAREAAAE